MPRSLATPQLGRLRELMLREARLLDSLHHECMVPLECGWLEQRTGEQPGDDGGSPWYALVNPMLRENSRCDAGAGTTDTALSTEITPGEGGGNVNRDDRKWNDKAGGEENAGNCRSYSAEEHSAYQEAVAPFSVSFLPQYHF